jgi:antitoxin (DNA-binding transcriptional repressor) of toxin-antitoxin stability system
MTMIASSDVQLLRRIAQGEEIVITEAGKPVAKLTAYSTAERPDAGRIIEDFKAYSRRQGRTLGDLTPRELIEEGRRF